MSDLRAAAQQEQADYPEEKLQAVAKYVADKSHVWYGIGARDVEEVLRQSVRCGLVGDPPRRETEQEPVAWIQPDHLQKARRAPFLCRVEPTQRCADFVPIYTAPPRPTGLPHCERSCEANAFQIEIRRLQAALKERDA